MLRMNRSLPERATRCFDRCIDSGEWHPSASVPSLNVHSFIPFPERATRCFDRFVTSGEWHPPASVPSPNLFSSSISVPERATRYFDRCIASGGLEPTPDNTIHLMYRRHHPDQLRSAIDPVVTPRTATTSTAITFWMGRNSYATSPIRQRLRSRPCADSDQTAAHRHQPRPPRDIVLLVRVLGTSQAAYVTIAAMVVVFRSRNPYCAPSSKILTTKIQ